MRVFELQIREIKIKSNKLPVDAINSTQIGIIGILEKGGPIKPKQEKSKTQKSTEG